MKKLILVTLATAALAVSAGAATAQVYYSGPGYGVHIGPRYDDGDRYEGRRYRYRDGERGYYRRGSYNGCRPHYTVQDGVCKPYTGR